ncbi:MAG: hypothetical protein CR986_05135 [Ignavibacteriae bacterium]|nr:MAG: hypothetical protein CR986_05135 [Ignavibacteriota bacterium]
MSLKNKIDEKQLHRIWAEQDFLEELTTFSNDFVTVIEPGNYNSDEAGPDFKDAKIKIGKFTYVGDIEIDNDYSDWKNHGHNINKYYNKVVLHVAYRNKQKLSYVYSSGGRKILSISLESKISVDNLRIHILEKNKRKLSSIYLKCNENAENVNAEIKRKFLLELGFNRFQKKCLKIFNRLKELTFISELQIKEPVIRYELTKQFREKKFEHNDFSDTEIWNQLFYELLFEALGYSKNKIIMKRFAQNVNLEYFKSLENNDNLITKIEASLFAISGLLPEKNENKKLSDYSEDLIEIWNSPINKYDGVKFDETDWQFLGQRPQNFPTIRLAGGAVLINSIINENLISNIIQKFSEIDSEKILINTVRSFFIIKANGYWQEHYVFEKQSKNKINYLIGLSRADEIFINIILPYLSVYFDIFGNREMSKKTIIVYNSYKQKLDNKIVREVSKQLIIKGLNRQTIYVQGMLELYKNYCSRNQCSKCKIGKEIF